MSGKRRGVLCAAIVLAVLALDRAVKSYTVTALALGESAPLPVSIVRLTRAHNYGAAWSSFSGARWLLVAVTALGIGVLIWLLWRVVHHPLGVCALAAVVGGGLGNLIDRVVYGYVVDMFDLTFMEYPVFNVADCFVVVGTIAAVIYYLWFYEKYDAKKRRNKRGNDPSDSTGN